MEYYSALIKKEILTFGTTRVVVEGIVIRDKKADKERQITDKWDLKLESRTQRKRAKWWRPGVGLVVGNRER